MFDSFVGEATAVFATAGVGLAMKSAKSPVLQLAGWSFLLFAIVQALGSPALLGAVALFGFGAFVYSAWKKRKAKAKKCPDCEHSAHKGSLCSNRHCTCQQ